MIFALIGNQNSGKTTLFNALTGSNQHVGNFPGVTVEQKVGNVKNVKDCKVVDLPGLYSIRAYSEEEILTRDFIFNQKPDGIINIVDATNLERNLYLTLQLITLKIPTVVLLNMMDEVRDSGGSINVEKLSNQLGVPVIPISAVKNEGISEAVSTAINVAKNKILPKKVDFCDYGPVHRCIHSVIHIIEDHADNVNIAKRFVATKLIEGESQYAELLGLNTNERELIEHSVIEMETESGLDRNSAIADMRYAFIEKICKDCVIKGENNKKSIKSQKIDKLLTNKYLAIPIFILIMAGIFSLTFQFLGVWLQQLLDLGITFVSDITLNFLRYNNVNYRICAFLEEGVFGGIGAVISLLPYIVLLFLFLSLLEDSGYMARIAFIMDRPLRKIGLSGRSFVSILMGFGCSVPAVMSTRTLTSKRDKKLTILMIPFISCSVKALVYTAVVSCGLFSPLMQILIILFLYAFGIILGVLNVAIASKTLFKGNPIPFVMELPNYRMPSIKSVAILMWEKASDFLKKAFSVIFIATLIIWVLNSYDIRLNFTENPNESLLGEIGNLLAPIFYPVTGSNDGRIVASLIAGFAAKEAVISTLSLLGATNIIDILPTIPSVLGFLTFVLLYTPCVATISALKRELKSGYKTLLIVIYQCCFAYIVSSLVRLLAVAIL